MMKLPYLANAAISEDILHTRESDLFNYATKNAEQRDKDYPDRLNERFKYITSPKVLQKLLAGWNIYEKHLNSESGINIQSYLKDLQKLVPDFEQVFSNIGRNLVIDNKNIPADALVVYWWPLVEVEQRIADTLRMNLMYAPQKIILSWWTTEMAREVGFPTEADYIADQLQKWGMKRDILLEKEAKNTWDNARFIEPFLWGVEDFKVITTDYDALRVALTNQAQTPFSWLKRVHGSPFVTDQQVLRSPDQWWYTEEWWRATLYTITRLVNYRAKDNPFI